MPELREEHRVGLDYLRAVTELLQRVRSAHSTHGSYEAAEVQFWWSIERSTDTLPQLFWFDDLGRPRAAVTATDFSDGSSLLYEEPTLVVTVMPDATPEWIAHVVDRGLGHVTEHGIGALELEVDQTDEVFRDVLVGHGFSNKGGGAIEAWLATDVRPAVSPLHDDYRLVSRQEVLEQPHHMAGPKRPDVEQRLLQTSLYRADLDLVIVDSEDNQAAYGLFWYDSETATGVVEPMRTHDDHQQRGLARHILTSGVDLLAKAGAKRIKIVFDPDNPAASHLYRSVGFEPHRQTDVFARGASMD